MSSWGLTILILHRLSNHECFSSLYELFHYYEAASPRFLPFLGSKSLITFGRTTLIMSTPSGKFALSDERTRLTMHSPDFCIIHYYRTHTYKRRIAYRTAVNNRHMTHCDISSYIRPAICRDMNYRAILILVLSPITISTLERSTELYQIFILPILLLRSAKLHTINDEYAIIV